MEMGVQPYPPATDMLRRDTDWG